MLALVSVRIRIGMKLANQRDIQAGFLLGLTYCCLLVAFTVINKATRKGPASRWVLPLNQDNALF
jgi:hypothetical protein